MNERVLGKYLPAESAEKVHPASGEGTAGAARHGGGQLAGHRRSSPAARRRPRPRLCRGRHGAGAGAAGLLPPAHVPLLRHGALRGLRHGAEGAAG